MKKACTYIRCSLGEERQQTSLKVQRTIISQFAENHGYTITKEFSDQESGRSIHRRGLIDCLQFAKTTGAKILIYRCDRLARTPQIWSLITDRLDSFRIVELGIPKGEKVTILASPRYDANNIESPISFVSPDHLRPES